MDFPQDFIEAFNHAMLYEVGQFWDPSDPEVIAGYYGTRQQRRKVGYVNIPADRGGETKYGIAQNANPDVRVCDLNLDGAMEIYFNRYWLFGKCHLLPYPLTIIHFDGCINHGVKRAIRFLQRAANVEDDGIIGSVTLNAIHAARLEDIITSLANIRRDFYIAIVERNASQKIFLNGWMRRINEVTDYTLAALNS